jgi:hypothetical protein
MTNTDAALAAFNQAVSGRLKATGVRAFLDRKLGGDAIRLQIAGVKADGSPFELTSLPINKNADMVACALSMVSVAQAYVKVAKMAAPVLKKNYWKSLPDLVKKTTDIFNDGAEPIVARLVDVSDRATKVLPKVDAHTLAQESAVANLEKWVADLEAVVGDNGDPTAGVASTVQSPKPGDA